MANLITPEAILSYVGGLFTPRAATDGGEEKYSVTLVFPEGTDLSELKQAVLRQAKSRWDLEGAEVKVLETQHGPANFIVTTAGERIRLPWRDHPEDVEKKGYPEGSTFVNTRNSSPPQVVSRIGDPSNDGKPARITNLNGDLRLLDGTVIEGARPIFSGIRGRGLLSVFDYSTGGNLGVSLGLQGVQITGDNSDERLDGRTKAEDAFDADVDAVDDLSDLQAAAGEQPATEGDQSAETGTEAAPVGGGGDDLSDLIGS